jgi:nucleoid DNA-binding protein
MTKTEMAVVIAAKTGLAHPLAYKALSGIENQLTAESKALRAVVLDDFGTFLPRQIDGDRMGRAFNGRVFTYENWKLVEDPKLVAETTFVQRAAKRAGIDAADFAQVLTSYKAQVTQCLRKGISVFSHELGSFKVSKRKARVHKRDDGTISTQTPARTAVVFKSCKTGQHQKFIAVAGLV